MQEDLENQILAEIYEEDAKNNKIYGLEEDSPIGMRNVVIVTPSSDEYRNEDLAEKPSNPQTTNKLALMEIPSFSIKSLS